MKRRRPADIFPELLRHIHATSQSSDPAQAVRGRCAEAIVSTIDAWLAAEKIRRSDLEHQIKALSRVLSGTMAAVALIKARPGRERKALEWARDRFIKDATLAFEATLSLLDENAPEGVTLQ